MNNTTEKKSAAGKHNHKYKDSLFRMIFGGKDERSAKWRLELYNALSGRNHTDPNDLKITTIENVIYITMKNDVTFLVDSQMTLYEHQSSWNQNMPLRGFIYFAKLYQGYISKEKQRLYYSSLIKLPSPQYIVFYNGNKKVKKISKLKLSDAFIDFKDQGEFEWTATMMNINKDVNLTLQQNCKSLYDYICFVDRIKFNLEQGMEKSKALEEAVEWAISENLLEGFFVEQKAEVIGMCLTEFDEEEYSNHFRKEGYDQGLLDGISQGAKQTAIANATNLLKMKVLTNKQISQAVGLSLKEIKLLSKKV